MKLMQSRKLGWKVYGWESRGVSYQLLMHKGDKTAALMTNRRGTVQVKKVLPLKKAELMLRFAKKIV